MSYTINLTNGTIFATIADGTINTSSSVTLVGKNYAGYGEFLDENYIQMLENFASSSTSGNPTNSKLAAPLTGQLWWDSTNSLMKVYNGSVWKTISASTASATAPSGANSVAGDLWYDTTQAQLNVYSGSAWIVVGPAYTAQTGTTGAIVATLSDGVTNHVVVELYVGGSIVGIVSKDAAFSPTPSISGFTQVLPGITLASLVGAQVPLFQGTATNAQLLDSLDSTSFMRSDANTSTTGTLSVINNTGLTVGSNSDFKASVSGTAVTLSNQTNNGNINISVNTATVPTTAIQIVGSNSAVIIPTSLSVVGNVTHGNVITGTLTVNQGGAATAIINGGSNAVGNIGSSSSYFNRVFALATTALYADVAERFAADEVLEAGTVVELGGAKEITVAKQQLSENVFGVISTQAAYLMNGGAGDDDTHPPVAMTGRVPVKVTGIVRKGDRLVSAGEVMARSAAPGEATAFNVIGRALVDKLTTDVGMVEAIVTIK
jgi:hypothetical protein